ncbi:MAG: phosphoribosylglycinamide formyltransferase, partial [Magnetococcales bacterium]|nr:phosphoribosylglycinamide formyltransferase [Magnetococcales bacterium]
GATVHYVNDGVDSGPIVVQAVVPILPNDDVKSLSMRILAQEHKIYPLAIRWFAQNRLRLVNGKVEIVVDRDCRIEEYFQMGEGGWINPPSAG